MKTCENIISIDSKRRISIEFWTISTVLKDIVSAKKDAISVQKDKLICINTNLHTKEPTKSNEHLDN